MGEGTDALQFTERQHCESAGVSSETGGARGARVSAQPSDGLAKEHTPADQGIR